MEAMGAIEARLNRAERDIHDAAQARQGIRKDVVAVEKEQATFRVNIEEIRSDVSEIKESTKWVLRALVGAIVTFTGLIITILVAVFSHA